MNQGYPQRLNVRLPLWWGKKVTYENITPKMMNPRDTNENIEAEVGKNFVCWLVAYRPSNMRVYLRDGSAQTREEEDESREITACCFTDSIENFYVCIHFDIYKPVAVKTF